MSALDALRAAVDAAVSVPPRTAQTQAFGAIYWRPLTLAEIEADQARVAPEGESKFARSILRVLCDESGARLPFTPADVAGVAALPWPVVKELQDAVEAEGAAPN